MSETPHSDPGPQEPVPPPPPSTPSPPPPPGAQPPSGAPVPPETGGAGDRDNTQLYGIIGIVLAIICCPPLGILFGYLSMQEARKAGKDQTLGKVAFWLGIAMTALGILGTILALCLGWGSWNWDNNPEPYD
jgi:hypothetical protein